MMCFMVSKPLKSPLFPLIFIVAFPLEMESLSTLNLLNENEITHNITDLLKTPLEMAKLGFGSSFL